MHNGSPPLPPSLEREQACEEEPDGELGHLAHRLVEVDPAERAYVVQVAMEERREALRK